MPYAWYKAWPSGHYKICCSPSTSLLSWKRPTTVQPYRSVFPGCQSYQMEQSCQKAMPQWQWPCKSKFQKVNPGLPEAVTRLSNVGDQLICWPCVAKKPAFIVIHDFMQRRTQPFSYLDSGYFHQTMELPTVQEKSKQIFSVQLKAHQY